MNTQIANTIAGQLHSMKPDHLVPGKDVGMEAIEKGVIVTIIPTDRIVRITLDEGRDLYDVTVHEGNEEEPSEYVGIFCDQLGEMVWGEDSKSWNLPFGSIVDMETGEKVAEW